jgi:hypothetical protein
MFGVGRSLHLGLKLTLLRWLVARQGAFHAPQMTRDMATTAWLPAKIMVYGDMLLVRKTHPTMLSAHVEKRGCLQ